MAAAVQLAGVTKRYGRLTSVDDLSLEIEEGEIFGLLGPNGSGKTTTLSIICGLVAPAAGRVRVWGLDPGRDSRAVRALLGVVPQETALYEDLTAWENLRYHYALYGRDLRRMGTRIGEVLELTGLTDRARDRVSTYSGGMKRRLALGRALLHEPQVLLLDEPTLGVDVQSTHAIWNHVHELRQQGKTVLVTTNVMAEADALCDRIAIIDHGRRIVVDTPAALKATVGADRVTLEVDRADPAALAALRDLDPALEAQAGPGEIAIRVPQAAARIQAILAALAGRCEVRRVDLRTPTLDDVFLNFTGRKLRD